MRDERRFDSVDLLKAQIAADVAKARILFEQMSL
jgi:FAD synthase